MLTVHRGGRGGDALRSETYLKQRKTDGLVNATASLAPRLNNARAQLNTLTTHLSSTPDYLFMLSARCMAR